MEMTCFIKTTSTGSYRKYSTVHVPCSLDIGLGHIDKERACNDTSASIDLKMPALLYLATLKATPIPTFHCLYYQMSHYLSNYILLK